MPKTTRTPVALEPITFTADNAALTDVFERAREVQDLTAAVSLMEWDKDTQMARGAAVVRGPQMGTLEAVLHDRLTAPEMGKAISKAEAMLAKAPDQFTLADHALVREARWQYDEAVTLPREFVKDFAAATTTAWEQWLQARAAKDFRLFAPALARVVDLSRQQAQYLNPKVMPYAALFTRFERTLPLDTCIAALEQVRVATVPLLQRIQAAKQIDDAPLRGKFAGDKILKFGHTLLEILGYRFANGRLDLTVHPFATPLGSPYDVRVTTRLKPNHIGESLLPIIHECGHALYEQGIDPALTRTLLARGISSSIHESQSRFWENIIGRSEPFWQAHYPTLQKAFAKQLGMVPLQDFVRALNRVQPSLIRVEADELTYNLHIIIRCEIERDLINGAIEVADLPALWNQKYHDYLGVTPPDDAMGVLQDMHWSGGMIGYFPTYAMGNLHAAQFAATIRQAMPDLDKRLAQGETAFLLDWLRTHIYRWGKLWDTTAICERVTGEPLNAQYFIDYATTKFTKLYRLKA